MECRREISPQCANSRSMELLSLSPGELAEEEADALCVVSNSKLANYRLTSLRSLWKVGVLPFRGEFD